MQTIAWTQELAVGVPAMDESHKALLKQLEEALIAPEEDFAQTLSLLITQIESDFREEENVMEAIDYPGIQVHQEQHARILGALHHISSRVMEGDVAVGREAVELLPRWFQVHMTTLDTALAFAVLLNEKESREASADCSAAEFEGVQQWRDASLQEVVMHRPRNSPGT